MGDVIIRKAVAADIPGMLALIFEHGPNEWNFLPRTEVTKHLWQIASGEVQAALAEKDKTPIGFVSFQRSMEYSRYQLPGSENEVHGYVAEAVVHRDHGGKGLGSQLLNDAVETLFAQGISEIYIIPHEENRGSAGMMKKAGFVEIDTFFDPVHRPNGSRRTTVCRITKEI